MLNEIFLKKALRKKCPYLELFWSAFSRIRTEYGETLAFGLNTERYSVSLRIQSECRKMRTRIFSYTDTFHAVKELKDAKVTFCNIYICTKRFINDNFHELNCYYKHSVFYMNYKKLFLCCHIYLRWFCHKPLNATLFKKKKKKRPMFPIIYKPVNWFARPINWLVFSRW